MRISIARATLMTATSAGLSLALGCAPSATDAAVDRPVDVDPTGTPTTTTAATETATAVRPAASMPTATGTVAATHARSADPVPQNCHKPERYCVGPRTRPESSGTGPPPDPNAPDLTAYDANGCASREDIGNTCNGINAFDGPKFTTDGKCCYEICRFPVPCGRPLVVDGEARRARVAARDDWAAGPRASGRAAHDAELRRAWRADAAMEHASVASFASLALSLLRWGAPASLVAGAHRAALDEIEHARLCFALGAGDEGSIGPSSLDVSGVATSRSLAELAASTVREGCIGEGVAALAAARALASCEDGAARAALQRIAPDELSHAALAFQIVAWAVATGGDDVRVAVERAVAEGLASIAAMDAPGVDDRAWWLAAGRLDRRSWREVAREAEHELLRPCLRHLLDFTL